MLSVGQGGVEAQGLMEAEGSKTEEVTWNDGDDGGVGPKGDEDGDRCRRPEIGDWGLEVGMTWSWQPSRIADVKPLDETVEILWELVSGFWDLSKVSRGLVGLGVRMHKQNTELIRLGKRQVYLAEQAMKSGLGSGSETEEEEEGSGRDKGKGKQKHTEGNDETLG
jgi:hypothetical protein